jgi:nucleotide-binding universal stress UspA family protein
MYTKIMIPVDLRHVDHMGKSLQVAADIAKLYNAETHIVGVGHNVPNQVARSPDEFAEKLAQFAAECSQTYGVTFNPHVETSRDPAVGLDDVLKRSASSLGIDLIVMASHTPGMAEYVFASNAGYLASHSDLSVLIVRQ